MTTIDFAVSTTLAPKRPAIVTRAAAWVSNGFRAWKNRREFYRLGEMSEIELHDIGLTRADLSVPTDLSFVADPTSHLARCARRRIDRMETYARFVA